MNSMTSTGDSSATPVVRLAGLEVAFPGQGGWRTVVRGIDLTVHPGEKIAVVGESGSGKTTVGLTLLGIQPPHARVRGEVEVAGVDVRRASVGQLRELRGGLASMVFQEPLTSLNPVRTVGSQLIESARRHQRLGRREARDLVVKALTSVGVPEPVERLGVYPHELSGGLRQRVMIALALLNRPALVVADEPTTALDATIQAQILELLRNDLGEGALLLVTHDLAVAAEVCDRLVVMYAGAVVEEGPLAQVVANPRHHYTRGLIAAAPTFDAARPALVPIPGGPPSNPDEGVGCRFAPRCGAAQARCWTDEPRLEGGVACWYPGVFNAANAPLPGTERVEAEA